VQPGPLLLGSFDLTVTRFSGARARADARDAGLSALGERRGLQPRVLQRGLLAGQGLGHPAFYSYAYPEPTGFAAARVRPAPPRTARLRPVPAPYDAVRTAADPDAALLASSCNPTTRPRRTPAVDARRARARPGEIERLERLLGRSVNGDQRRRARAAPSREQLERGWRRRGSPSSR
jgi:hypothetical protein